jgi:peptide/nickel transport system ATP-binding protein
VHLRRPNLLTLKTAERQPMRRRIQIVFQNPYASLNPRFTIGQTLVEPMAIHGIGADTAEREQRARALLDKVGLDASAFGKYPHEFSGGQRQRVAIARCLTLEPRGAGARRGGQRAGRVGAGAGAEPAADLQDELGLAYVFISHDLAVVRFISDEVLVMKDGEVVEQASARQQILAPRRQACRHAGAGAPVGARPGATVFLLQARLSPRTISLPL